MLPQWAEGLWEENSGVTKWYGWAEGNNSFSPGDSLKYEKKRECEGKKRRCPHLFPLSPSPLPSFLPFLVLLPHFTPFLSRFVSLPHYTYHGQNFHHLNLYLLCPPPFSSLYLFSFCSSPFPLLFSSRGSVKCQCIVLGDTADKNGVWYWVGFRKRKGGRPWEVSVSVNQFLSREYPHLSTFQLLSNEA